jgi:hypothetical protein
MELNKIVNTIHELTKDFIDNVNERNDQREILVMHPSALILIKDLGISIIPITTPTNTYYRIDNKIDCVLFNGLPKHHFTTMKMKEYKELVNPFPNETTAI